MCDECSKIRYTLDGEALYNVYTTIYVGIIR